MQLQLRLGGFERQSFANDNVCTREKLFKIGMRGFAWTVLKAFNFLIFIEINLLIYIFSLYSLVSIKGKNSQGLK